MSILGRSNGNTSTPSRGISPSGGKRSGGGILAKSGEQTKAAELKSAFRRLNAKDEQSYNADKMQEAINLQRNANRADVNLSPAASLKYRTDIANQKKLDAQRAADDKAAYDKLPKIRKLVVNAVHSPIGKRIMGANEASSDFLRRSLDTSSLGGTDMLDRTLMKSPILDAKSKEVIQKNRDRSQHTVAGEVGSYAGYLTPGTLADRAAVMGLRPLVKNAPKLVRGVARALGGSALFGVADEAGQALTGKNNQTLSERAKDVAFDTGAGLALHGVGAGLGAVINKGLQSVKDTFKNVASNQIEAVMQAMRKEYPSKLKSPGALNQLDEVMTKIKPIVEGRLTPPMENPDELARWLQKHLGIDNISLNEIRKIPYDSMRQLAEEIRPNINVATEAHKAAAELGYDLPALLDGKGNTIAQRVTQQASERAYGIYPKSLPNVIRPLTRQGNLAASEVAASTEAGTSQGGILHNASKDPAYVNASVGKEPQPVKVDPKVTMFNESGFGDVNTFDQKINRDIKPNKKTFAQKWERVRTHFTDDLAPLEGVEKRVRGNVASAEDSLYKAARMFKGVPEKAAKRVQQSLAPIVKEIEKAGFTADDLGRYALAKHAKDVNAAGMKSGFTNAEIDAVLRKYGTPEMESAQQKLVQVNHDMLQELVDSHVVSKGLANTLKERWKNYIPLFRSFDDAAVDFETGLSNALANVASPIKSLQGSEKAVIDPMENIVKNIYRSTNAAERNKVALQLPKLAEIDTAGKYIRRLNAGEEVGRKNVVNVKVNGENVKYEVEPEVHKALLNLDQESSNMIINILAKPASLLRAGATLTPDFSLRNPIRDVKNAYVVSKSGFNPVVDFPVGVVQAILGQRGKGKLYQEWVDNLGAYGNVMSMDRNVHRQSLEKVLGEPASKKVVNIINGKSFMQLLRTVSDIGESATKIGEYRAAIRSGASPQEAAYRSRDLMDFARAGSGIRQTNKIVAFLNAGIQGDSKLIRAIKENPVRVTTRAVTAVTLPTVGVFFMQKYWANDTQKETIANAPNWQRDTFWLVPVPGTDTVARIPKPFGLNLIFANPVEHALEHFFNKDKAAFDGFAKRTASEAAIPTQISGLLPFIEGMSNYSFFRDGSIIPQREQGLQYSDQYDPIRTSETAKLLAKGADKLTGGKGAFKNFSSPRIMDNTIQGLTAGLGKYATDAVDAILQRTGAVDRPKAPAKSLEQQPLLRSFLVDPNQGGKVTDDFYSQREKLSKEKSSAKLRGLPFADDKKKKLDVLEKTNDKLSGVGKTEGINSKIRGIEKSVTLTPQEKRRQIDTLTAERLRLIRDAMNQIK